MGFFDRVRKTYAQGENTLADEDFWKPILKQKSTSALNEITYFICMKALCESVAKLPLKLYKETERGIEKATDLPLYNKLKLRPNQNMTATTFWSTVELIKNHYGNAYVYPKYKNPLGAPELIILDSNYVQVYVDNAKVISKYGGVWYIYSEPATGNVFKIPQSDILHFKTNMTFDGLVGLAVKDILKASVEGAKNSQNFINKLYKNGLTGKVALEYTQDLDEKHVRKLKNKIETAVDMSQSAINIFPLPYGLNLKPLNLKLTDAQFFELKKYSALQIAAAFGIKPNQLNDYEKSSYNNSEHQQITFLQDTLLVILKGYEEELTTKLLRDDQIEMGYFFKFNVDALLRATFAERMEGYHKARNDGWMSANDIRCKEDLPLIPVEEGGNAYLINGNMVPITNVMKGGDTSE